MLQVPEADAGDRRDLHQQADLHRQDREPGPGHPAQPHPVSGLLHHHQGTSYRARPQRLFLE